MSRHQREPKLQGENWRRMWQLALENMPRKETANPFGMAWSQVESGVPLPDFIKARAKGTMRMRNGQVEAYQQQYWIKRDDGKSALSVLLGMTVGAIQHCIDSHRVAPGIEDKLRLLAHPVHGPKFVWQNRGLLGQNGITAEKP